MMLELTKPVQFGSETITKLIFREPKAKDMRGLSTTLGMNDLLTLAQELSGQPKYIIDELSVTDARKVLEIVGQYFLADGPETGVT